mmetsp:Transcript_8292/g.23109  ORF Transcript_8292/g.23109 Transcript_8292/m.23109 type:complete len:212 (-) Transcript_8292:117-752(-)
MPRMPRSSGRGPAALLPVQMLRFHRPLPSGLPHELAGGNARRRGTVRAVLAPLPLPAAVRAGRAGSAAPARGPARTRSEHSGEVPPVRAADRAVAVRMARRPAAVRGLPVSELVPFAKDGGVEVAHRSASEGWRIRRRRGGHRRGELPESDEFGRLYALPVESGGAGQRGGGGGKGGGGGEGHCCSRPRCHARSRCGDCRREQHRPRRYCR